MMAFEVVVVEVDAMQATFCLAVNVRVKSWRSPIWSCRLVNMMSHVNSDIPIEECSICQS